MLPQSWVRHQHQHAPQDSAQDSLLYDTGDETARSYGGGFVQDSLNMYNAPLQQPQLQQPQLQQPQLQQPQLQHPQLQQPQQQPVRQFRNPPQLPQEFVSYHSNRQQQGSRLDNVNFDSEDYTEHVDIRQQRVNPQIRPRFYNPYADQPHDNPPNGEYIDNETDAEDGSTGDLHALTQRYEDRQEDDELMEAVQPKPPKYDYINNNKDDLGRSHPKSYIKIHEVSREEKERLNDIFIRPKPKPKGSTSKKKDQGQQRSQFKDFQPPNENHRVMTEAEQVRLCFMFVYIYFPATLKLLCGCYATNYVLGRSVVKWYMVQSSHGKGIIFVPDCPCIT